VANASIMTITSTSGIASEMAGTDLNIDIDSNEKQFHEMLRGGRRIEQTSADDNENDSKQSSSSSLFSSTTVEECTVPAGTCMHCTFSEQKTYDVCLETGRWQKFECLLPSASNPEDESQDTMYKWKSCKHTDLEGGLAMVRSYFCSSWKRKTENSSNNKTQLCISYSSFCMQCWNIILLTIFFTQYCFCTILERLLNDKRQSSTMITAATEIHSFDYRLFVY
jgi:hypothetical protein